MIAADLRPMSSAPLDGTPVRLFASIGSAIASFWTEERSQKEFGAGDYRVGWYLFDDDAIEFDDPGSSIHNRPQWHHAHADRLEA
jgi:hypothetical protein